MIAVKQLTPQHAVVAGYGVRFGSHDLVGDQFTRATDFGLGLVPDKPVFYDHTQEAPQHPLGRITRVVADDLGLWVEAQLDRSRAYVAEVLKLIDAGVLGWSSGSVAHLVRREGGIIKSWPIVEFSLTPTPAEPRCLGVEHSDAGNGTPTSFQKGANTMTTNKTTHKTTHEQQNETAALATNVEHLAQRFAHVEGVLRRFEGVLDAPAVRSGFVLPGDTSHSDDQEQEAVKAFQRYVRTGTKAPLQEGTAEEGGYLVPRGYSSELVAALATKSVLRAAGARIISVRGTNSFRVPTMTYSGAAVLTAEEGTYDEAEPTLGEVEFIPYKYTRLSKVSDELLDDSRIDVMNHVLIPDAVQAFATAENSAFTSGAGPLSTQPEGVITGASVGKTAASATAITADELMDLYHALPHMYRQNAVWMMNDTTAAQVRKLRENGTDGNYLWQPGLMAGQPDRLLGRPVFTNNSMDTPAASKKVVLFGDLTYYWVADFGGISLKRLDELYAASGQVGFRFFRRIDARVMLADALQVLQMAAA